MTASWTPFTSLSECNERRSSKNGEKSRMQYSVQTPIHPPVVRAQFTPGHRVQSNDR